MVVVVNVSLMVNVVPLNIATTSSVYQDVNNVEREQHAQEYKDTVLYVNVQLDILEVHYLNVVQNVMEILIVPEVVQLVTMEFARIHVLVLVELVLIAISVD